MKTKQRSLRLDKAIAQTREELKGQKGIDKKLTAIKTGAADEGDYESGIMAPTDDQLQKINQFTRTPKTAAEVVVFNTLSCNDLLDRDDDKFTKDTVDGFANLEQPYSPIGKAFMVSHDYTKLPVGRIFDGEATTIKGTRWLKNSVYMPNTEQYKNFIENQDFGIYWAVSVGVMLEQMLCGLSFCGAEMITSRFFGSFCMEGHDKSMWYVKDGETDDWGYPYPVDPSTKGAEKCIGLMKGAKDFYELSQGFLGAQFYAALDKEAPGGLGKIIKAASASGVPILGLSQKEAEELPLQHVDKRVSIAMAKYAVEHDGETLRWADEEGLLWTFDPEVGEVLCLGKQTSDEDDDADDPNADSDPADDDNDSVTDDSDEDDDDTGEEDEDGSHKQLGRRGQADDPDALGEGGDKQPATERGPSDPGGRQHGQGESDRQLTGSVGDLTALKERLAVCRGKVASLTTATTRATDDESSDDNDENATELAEAIDAVLDEVSDALDNEEYDQASSLLDSAETTVDQLIEVLGGTDADDEDTNDTKGVEELSKKAVLAAATKARVPASILTKVNEAEGNGLDVLLREVVTSGQQAITRVTELEPKAALGDAYVKDLRTQAIDWYVKAHQVGENAPVNVENFTKILDACGDNHELIKSLADEQRDAARAKFPAAVRRSGFESDPHARTTPEPVQQPGDGEVDPRRSAAVRRIHG